ncbi:NADP-dependent oxidoreductase [Rhabdobacter roseus]|uniref:NADPH:quinone reductase-like Zn-dependent oxidoreductase n=1 Tax=Rhabdobacter roseus TaxID=1655419 RepID=A0A840U457_9BACT|nr:NAD(P)-dependent alcohol dehydrogenase [Rhabdobacter roseus]MBB5286619.1 NADPH:quinone reductase-like Zn-dependent oxidoreductase [Rhabdobacter roseus]
MMKAAVLEKYGSSNQFKIKVMESPQLKDGQILVRNRASSVNPVDTLVRRGTLKLVSGLLGDQIIGADFSGTVIASRSSRFQIGDEVFGFNSAIKGGAYAEEVAVDEEHAALKPTNCSFTEAAVLPLVALTAWQGLVDEGHLKAGNRVLIHGCTGGVGSAAVQVAKSLGAVVTGTCSTPHVAFAQALGCDKVFDYKKEKVPPTLLFDLIFDATGQLAPTEIKDNLAQEALFISTRGGVKDVVSAVDAALNLIRQRMKVVVVKPKASDLMILKELVESGKVKPYIARTFPLEEVGRAHDMLENESFTGKIAISI